MSLAASLVLDELAQHILAVAVGSRQVRCEEHGLFPVVLHQLSGNVLESTGWDDQPDPFSELVVW